MELQYFSESFARIFRENGMGKYVNDDNIKKFYDLTVRMLEVNEYMNLTAITEPEAVILRHYVDSLTVSDQLPQGARVIDIGCGAGFPTLPLAIVRPDLHILALDSTAKRIDYVAQTAQMLGLNHVEAVASRAEDAAAVGTPLRESFDCAISRAVANLPVLCELSLPFVAVGGRFVAMKAAQADREVELARGGIAKLGGRLTSVVPLELVGNDGKEERNLILTEKIEKTPKIYPRNYAQIKKKPL